MNNLLILTNIYPSPNMGKGDTPVVHYFTKEWVNMGYDVRVIHYPANFPRIFMWGAFLFKKQISSRLGVVIRTKTLKNVIYKWENVSVARFPLLKTKLHGAFSSSQINKAYDKTIAYLEKEGFIPDVIISHWVNPQLEIMDRLKKKYGVKTCYVAHVPPIEFERIYTDEYSQSLIDKIDLIGFRSAYIRDKFCEKFTYNRPSFQCYSGVPEKYIPEHPHERDFKNVSKFVFVGTLIKRKYPAEIIPALAKVYGNVKFDVSYIGKGIESKAIEKYAKDLNVEENVHQLGFIPRDQVVEELQKADVFVMISRNEAFGLVYLEAMAQGCITIAVKKEGFDGIIQHGVNGFLCEAGNVNELANLVAEIRGMAPDKLQEISLCAIETAKSLTDVKAAKLYIESVKKYCK